MADFPTWATAVATMASVGVSIYAVWKANKASDKADVAKNRSDEALQKAGDVLAKTAQGEMELHLRQLISQRRDKIDEVSRDMEAIRKGRAPEALSAEEKNHLADVYKRFETAHESVLNAYEEACGKYRDKKVDSVRFRQFYNSELREVVTVDAGHPFYTHLHPEGVSSYKAIWRVYHDWNDLENQPHDH